MVEETESPTLSDVDKSLVAAFLKMSPEERVHANDTAARVIAEMRHACREQQDAQYRSERPA